MKYRQLYAIGFTFETDNENATRAQISNGWHNFLDALSDEGKAPADIADFNDRHVIDESDETYKWRFVAVGKSGCRYVWLGQDGNFHKWSIDYGSEARQDAKVLIRTAVDASLEAGQLTKIAGVPVTAEKIGRHDIGSRVAKSYTQR